jgi:ubiquinone biosynthesis accessory factor UbiJ
MLDVALIAGLNHLLAGASWARTRLIPFAGRHARFEIPPVHLSFTVGSGGNLESSPDGNTPDVIILLPANTPFLLPQGLDKVMALARVEGNAEFATELSFVLRNLHWDAEEDLSRVVGDIAAHRLVKGAGQLAVWKRQAVTRLAENLVEYLAHENPLLVAKAEFDLHRAKLATLSAELARFNARIDTVA